ncbi:NADase-type glycan-binding domain-containing protein [Streptomyces sp. DSM 15324]|uniref:NADase-type glycan-binding domain-containing protein n=1 Tax=Streptomyces sp. DSM 15324 TaxID=1739111 RepID=UPI0007494259|nr:hypothetical protein [Streptomyces sp. DSM 15324]KUO09805.1 hypothetical protein AQJ58_22375 [Streptomyces sp. DSM 15324]
MTSQPPATGSGRDGAARCAECGTRAAPGQFFCDSCGAVLRWARRTARGGTAEDAREADEQPTEESGPTAGRPASRSGREPAPAAGDRNPPEALGVPATVNSDRSPGSVHDDGPDTTPGDSAYADVVASFGEAPSTGTRAPEPDGAPPRTPASGERGPDRREPETNTLASSTPDTTGPDTNAPDMNSQDDGPHTTRPADDGARTGRLDDDAPTAQPPATPPAASGVPDDTIARARSLLVPVADAERRTAPAPSVPAVLPGRPDTHRPQVRTPGRAPGTDGGVPCPWCGTPNRADRHFCGLCAMPQSRAPQATGPRPWWHRVLDPRNRETPRAGDRPRLRRGFGYLMTWALWAVPLTLLVTAVVNADNAVSAVRDHFAQRGPVGPDSVKASRSYPRHGPELAFDKLSNTWWGPGVNQSGAGEWIEARFDQPTQLLDVIITPGVSPRADQLAESALPRRVEAVITTADGTKESRFLTLDQAAGGQRRAFRVGEVTAVRLIVRSSYAVSADKQVAIAEIEFFGPSNSGTHQ